LAKAAFHHGCGIKLIDVTHTDIEDVDLGFPKVREEAQTLQNMPHYQLTRSTKENMA